MVGAIVLNRDELKCHYTGLFLLLVIIPVAPHGFAILPFGPEGWRWLGITVGVGSSLVWFLSEKLWRRYQRKSEASGG